MGTITCHLGTDHKRCDEFFASAETSVSKNRWDDAAICLKEFSEALERHFAMEEKVLFPVFEKAIGSSDGPTSVMRTEHRQIRSILEMLHETWGKSDADSFLGYSDTLNTMLQQHNMKEESVLPI
jgi:hemerythrin-like domain-containing protein